MELQIRYSRERMQIDNEVENIPIITLEMVNCGNRVYFSDEFNVYKNIDADGEKFYLKTEECTIQKVDELIEVRRKISNKRDSISIIVDQYNDNVVNIPTFIDALKEKIKIEHMMYLHKTEVVKGILEKCFPKGRGQLETNEYYRFNEEENKFEIEE
ncbi:MAG: hypothetical protein E6590_09095 [Clostridiales bacterium]|uniref:hypothetical protein n=1 Tax=Zhenhengia sp. TaxID=2944208 RepID=UPI0020569884|nr:hypothetical protein [Clostridiales bacterium]DAY47830.1 MAG TPA: hypothetical protein [Caudoviricetes sp.]